MFRKDELIMERMRRLRVSPAMRSMVRENHLRVDELICPIFVIVNKVERNWTSEECFDITHQKAEFGDFSAGFLFGFG